MARTRTIRVDHLARVEGEGALHLSVDGDEVRDLRLEIYEPPRYFEAFLRGRGYLEVADIVARICGICPVAYQMSALGAIESILGLTVSPALRELRRLFYCGEWIESHVLHVAMLAAPDFLGCESVVELAQGDPRAVERALALRKVGNAIVTMLGGRSIHPVSARPGGFTRVPGRGEMESLLAPLTQARGLALELLTWVSGFPIPDRSLDVELVALRHGTEYPLNEGRIVSSRGLDLSPAEWEGAFEELQVPHSTALHARIRGRGAYLVGPLARLNLNFDCLSRPVRDAAHAAGLQVPTTNPYQGVLARAVETLFAVDEAIRIVGAYQPPDAPYLDAAPRAGVGFGATEAPRGVLFHRIELDALGLVKDARIVPPTSQNLATIENDLRALAPSLLAMSQAEATRACEVAIRNYDPCISCSTHFLRLDIDRSGNPSRAPSSEPAPVSRKDGTDPPRGHVRVVCVGSPVSGDDTAFEVARLLLSNPLAAGVEVVTADRPGADLVGLLGGADAVVVVDTFISQGGGTIPASVIEVPLSEVGRAAEVGSPMSSHGLGVAEAVGLAASLGVLPASSWFVGVHRQGSRPEAEFAVRAAVKRVCALVEALLRALG